MAALIYDPTQPQDNDNALVIAHKTAVNVSNIADVIGAVITTFDPPQPQTGDSEFMIERKTAVNVSRIANTICPI